MAETLTEHSESWEWFEISLLVAVFTVLILVCAVIYLMRSHKRQWMKMQQMDQRMEQDISTLIERLQDVPNIQKTTAVLVDENQINKKQAAASSGLRWIYLDQLLGRWILFHSKDDLTY